MTNDDREIRADGGQPEGGPVGTDAPAFPSDMSTFESAVRRRMSGNWSLASGVWDLKDESSDRRHLVTFYHRDSISRIQISSQGTWVDADARVEVYRPLSKAEARQGPEDDVNDVTVTDKTFDMLGEGVWFAEYFARSADERIPDDPATNLYGPVDGEHGDAETDGGERVMTDGGRNVTEGMEGVYLWYELTGGPRSGSRTKRRGEVEDVNENGAITVGWGIGDKDQHKLVLHPDGRVTGTDGEEIGENGELTKDGDHLAPDGADQ